MAQKLRVRTPVTRDGVQLVYDANKRPVYRETIVEPWARKQFESLNSSMAEHLRHELEDFDDAKPQKAAAKPAEQPETEAPEQPATEATPAGSKSAGKGKPVI